MITNLASKMHMVGFKKRLEIARHRNSQKTTHVAFLPEKTKKTTKTNSKALKARRQITSTGSSPGGTKTSTMLKPT
jgi:chemotaxis response regulator CheB